MKKILIPLIIIATMIGTMLLVNPKALTKIDSNRVISAEPPIILVHGFNQNSNFWSDIHLISSLEEQGSINMGNFHSTKNNDIELLEPKDISAGQSALYTLTLPENGTQDIRDSAILLEKTIAKVISRHRCEKVRLIAFSAGGIVCREYLSKHPEQHHTESLTTVSAPHLGSEHAWLCVSYHNLKSMLTAMQSDNSGNFITKSTRKATAYSLGKFSNQLEK